MEHQSSNIRPLKITVVGDGTVGKTCLLVVHKCNKFPNDYVPTVFEEYCSEIVIHGKSYNMILWDTAGQEGYDRVRLLAYPNTDVFILCYSVDNRKSFENIESRWIPELRFNCPKVPIVLVGTKSDMREEDSNDIYVMEAEGKLLAKRIKAAFTIECSSKFMINVHQVFELAIRAALRLSLKDRSCCFL